jgi:hypothetical protein
MSLLACALTELASRFEGYVVDTTPGVATLEVVIGAPGRNPSNQLGKNTSATTLGVVEIASCVSPSNKLGVTNRMD